MICLIGANSKVTGAFVFSSRCLDAYKAIFDLRLNDARLLIREEKQQNPQNGITLLLDNYVDYFSLLTSDNRADYDQWKDRKFDRTDALEKNDKNSPWYLFTQAEVFLQWGMVKARFGDYMSSAIDIKKARNLLKDNAQQYPDFLPNQKSLALIDVIFGAMPANLKAVAGFLGMKGNATAGVAQMGKLKAVVTKTKYSYYNDEIVFLLCYLDVDILHHNADFDKLQGYLAEMDKGSLLKAYLSGYVASKTAHNAAALLYFADRPQGSQYIDIPVLYYYWGLAKLYNMENDAPNYLNRFIKTYKGQNFIKDAYLKLGYFYLLRNDMERYGQYIKLVRTKGSGTDEKDKEAHAEANDAQPDEDLLKARLFYDGGYFAKALIQLKNRQVATFRLLRDKIEFYYRLGRIYEQLDQFNDALANYQQTITIGKNAAYYFAANAALSSGEIYERQKDYDKAAAFYTQALNMKNHSYQNSIDTRAKSGLARLHKE